jgi:hypothetical protein
VHGSPQHTGRLGDNFNHFWKLYEKRFYTHAIIFKVLRKVAGLFVHVIHLMDVNSRAGARGLVAFFTRSTEARVELTLLLLAAATTGAQPEKKKYFVCCVRTLWNKNGKK